MGPLIGRRYQGQGQISITPQMIHKDPLPT
jgi:hypothetical protein